jgi:hypothetical protein
MKQITSVSTLSSNKTLHHQALLLTANLRIVVIVFDRKTDEAVICSTRQEPETTSIGRMDDPVKNKVFFVLDKASRHEDVWRNRGMVPLILNLGTSD